MGDQFTDEQVAYMVRMLMPGQLDHEMICVLGRDRIKALSAEVATLCARIAELQAERDNAMRYTELLIQERDASNKLAEECSNEAQCAQSDLDAARAGEARAVEALKVVHERCDLWHFDDCSWAAPKNTCSCGYRQIVQEAALILSSAQPALDWLSQREREAAAEELEEIAKDAVSGGGKARMLTVVYREFPDRLTIKIGVVEAADIMSRAAALRAGNRE